jgi:uncharacterized protein YgbK (DUF1537 family)
MSTAIDPDFPQLHQEQVLASLPPVWPEELGEGIRAAVRQSGRKLMVLDDDPTGTQTVYDIPVITEWSVERLESELLDSTPAFYLLTNSRSMPESEAVALHRLIAANLQTAVGRLEAAEVVPPKLSVVSRSDSTLRGHFPAETDALQAALGPFDAVFLIPFFAAGGRMTIDDVHYVAQGQWLLPAATTPFARDAVFGYRSSHLREWIAEKTAGRVPADAVASLGLDELRQGGPAAVLRRLCGLPAGSICVVNAAAERDLEVFVRGLLDAETQGRRYLFRTAASFVAARLGLAPRPLLDGKTLPYGATSGGLTIVGSYVPCTNEQLQRLLDRAAVVPIELDVPSLLDANRREETVRAAIADLNRHLAASRDVVLYTSRQLITHAGADANLETGRIVSEAIVRVVRQLAVPPRYLIAKGGITSSDVATRGLGVRRALVLGQILPGVPIWRLGAETAYPGLPYVVFPGNVGGPEALAEAVAMFQRPGSAAR